MHPWSIFALLCFPIWLHGQQELRLGVNVSPLVVNTLEIHSEWKVSPSVRLEGATGFRFQQLPVGSMPRLQFLRGYMQRQNQAGFLTLGARLVNATDNPYEYPFMSFALTGLRFQEEVLQPAQNGNDPELVTYQGWRLGASMTIGFTIRLQPRLHVDLAMQMGYSPPREELLQYYYPGLGFSTYSPSAWGFRGGHLQPLIALKYSFIQDRRERLYHME